MTLNTATQEKIGDLTVRAVTLADVDPALGLIKTSQLEHEGQSNLTAQELLSDWSEPGFDVELSTLGVFTPENVMVAYAEVWDNRELPVRPHLWIYIHPEYRHLPNIPARLTAWGESRARQVMDRVPPEARVVLEASARSTDNTTRDLLKTMGMTYAERSWWHMLIDLPEEPEKPVWPGGITVTTQAELNDLAAVYRAKTDSFKDHRGHVDESFEVGFTRFQHNLNNDDKYDPALFFLAMDGDTIAGVSLCRIEHWNDPEEGLVGTLGVLRDHRKRGLGLALLLHSFNELWQRGKRKVGLFVDGSSITGATRLYEKAGMYVHTRFDAYEKELRPGVELSNQG